MNLTIDPAEENAFFPSVYSLPQYRGKKRDRDGALADYSKAIELDPDFSVAYDNRGVLWDKKQELNKALSDFKDAIRFDPKNIKALRNRAAIWRKMGKSELADNDIAEAERLGSL